MDSVRDYPTLVNYNLELDALTDSMSFFYLNGKHEISFENN